MRFDGDRTVDQPARRQLVARTLGAVREAVGRTGRRAPRELRDQRRFREPLQIENRVVAVRLQLRFECPPLGAHAGLPPCCAPAPQRALDDRLDAFDPPQQRCESGLDDPVDHRTGECAADVVHHRHRVHDIAERRELDDQDAHLTKSLARRVHRAISRGDAGRMGHEVSHSVARGSGPALGPLAQGRPTRISALPRRSRHRASPPATPP